MSGFYYVPAAFIEKRKLYQLGKSIMHMLTSNTNEQLAAAAFSAQSVIFDQLYSDNKIVQYKRERVRDSFKKIYYAG